MALYKCCVVWTYNRTALRSRAVNMQWNAYGIMFRVVWYMLGFQPVCVVCALTPACHFALRQAVLCIAFSDIT